MINVWWVDDHRVGDRVNAGLSRANVERTALSPDDLR
jgi:hypothetical protein